MNQEAEIIDGVRHLIRTRYRGANDYEEMESYILHRIMVQYARLRGATSDDYDDYMSFMMSHARYAASTYMLDRKKRMTFIVPLFEGDNNEGMIPAITQDDIPMTTANGYTYPRWRLPVPVASKCNVMTDDLRLAIRNLVTQLNAEQQEVVRLHWWEKESIQDIAVTCKKTVAQVSGVIVSIVEELRELVLQYNDDVRRFGESLSSMLIPGRVGDGEGLLMSLAIASATVDENQGHARRYWTPPEDDYIRKHYGQMDIKTIAEVLDRKYNSVVKRASVLRRKDG